MVAVEVECAPGPFPVGSINVKQELSSMKSLGMKPLLTVLSVLVVSLVGCGVAEEASHVSPGSTSQALAGPYDAWVARHALTAAQYQTEFNTWTGQGYRLSYVSGYEDGGSVRYAAIWEQTSGPAWRAFHGLTSAQYQTTAVNQNAQGYRPVVVNGYSVGGVAYFAVIFHSDGVAAWVARHDLTAAQYQTEFNTWTGQGYRLVHVSGYTSGGAERYAAVWEQTSGPAARAYHGLTAAQYQSTFNTNASQGYQVAKVSSYNVGGTDRYAAIFHASAGIPIAARHGLTSAGYQQAATDLKNQGYRPVVVAAHNNGSQPEFALVWQNLTFSAADLRHIDTTVQQAMSNTNTVGLSLAITRRGRLVFAKGYGLADQANSTPVNSSHRFRVASVSKPMTSIGIMKLIENGQIQLTDRVFGRGGLLGETYGAQGTYRDSRVLNITVQQLLEHTAGGWDNDGADGTGDPMFMNTSMTHAQLIQWVLQNVSLEFAPGTTYQYSNFGYSVLGRIIERVTGMTYDAYMQSQVFTPSGATSFAVGGDTLAARLSNEVAYYQLGAGAFNPYGMPVRRMDAHGGWVVTPIDLLRVSVRADGYSTVPDLLSTSSLTTMTTRTTAPDTLGNPVNYAKGWSVNSLPNWWHGGYVPGTLALLVRTDDRYGPNRAEEFTWSAMTNSNNRAGSGTSDINLDSLMWSVVNGVSAWPAHDLF
ncbi:beta-lactamase family protein [Myxococcus llanfairpwllgwyngyllgogerychwyrndrobwllllantysiliogogogochensis]|uniref:Beta-lactamase family protein n=2 Tax=Myxococcus llanfairpwllgwyngyllgogerychwyrndrobwllllantysiliogogogochensis TaxID=2590453 RepID=A0A540X0Q1_9BACT|nr:beta-lactamase family protein [Myxococcus llanfairpwllgwyngyllgogerychwyrndrobwllllantysiliogogogochensis]